MPVEILRLADIAEADAYRRRSVPALRRLARWHRTEADSIDRTAATIQAEGSRPTS